MSLETHISGAEDKLIDGLSFAGRNTASYVTERRNCSFQPQSGGLFSPNGIRLMRFNLADQTGWLQGDTVRLVFQIQNTTAQPLVPICDTPNGMFRRLRVICNGSAIVEDIEEYSRVSQMFATLLPSARRYNDIRESWGATTDPASLSQPFVADPIPAGASRTVVVHLLSSMLSQGKAIPLNMLPLVLELELDDANRAFAGDANAWLITRPRLIADVMTLDASLQNSYAKHILDGSSIPIMMHGLYSLKATITDNTQFSLPINRGFSRLSTIYWSFIGPDGVGKEVTTFFHPLRVLTDPADAVSPLVAVTAATDTFSWNITVGSDRYPQFDCDSVGESFHRLRMAQLVHQGSDSFSISSSQYRSDKAIFACSFEKAPGQASHTGINTRSGSQVCLNFKNVGAARQVHVVLHYEVAVNVSSAGCEILD
jgi:hypothetical protein